MLVIFSVLFAYFLITLMYLLVRKINKNPIYIAILDIYILIYFVYILIPFSIFILNRNLISETFFGDIFPYKIPNSLELYLYPLLILLLFLLGSFIYMIFPIHKIKISKFRKYEYHPSNIENLSWFITLSVLIFIVIAYFALNFGNLLATSISNLALMKYELLNKTGWKPLIIIFMIINPLILIVSYSTYKISNNRLFLIIISISLLMQTISILLGFRVYILIYLLTFYILYIFFRKKDINLYLKFLFLLFLLMLYGFLTVIMYNSFHYGLFRAINRLIAGLKGMFICFDLSEEQLFFGKTYIWKAVSLLPGEQITLQGYISPFEGVIFEPTIVGELYINFSYAGIIIAFIFGFFSTFVLQYFLKKAYFNKYNLFSLVMVMSYSIFLFRSVMGGLEAYILIFLYLSMFFIIISIYKVIKLLLLIYMRKLNYETT